MGSLRGTPLSPGVGSPKQSPEAPGDCREQELGFVALSCVLLKINSWLLPARAIISQGLCTNHIGVDWKHKII